MKSGNPQWQHRISHHNPRNVSWDHVHRVLCCVVLENVSVFENVECVSGLKVALLHEGPGAYLEEISLLNFT